jgi:hypothetical protein
VTISMASTAEARKVVMRTIAGPVTPRIVCDLAGRRTLM